MSAARCVICVAALCELGQAARAEELSSPSSFARIADREARAAAIFGEMAKVILHPRCVNCHPAGETPLQGDRPIAHDPPVFRGPADQGVPGLLCSSCHQDRNLELARVPGAPKWHLAPKSMAWVGLGPRAICEQVKDPKRNGGKTVAQIVEHMGHDPLVAWAFAPGHGRTPAPGTQKSFGALASAWAQAGAGCPKEMKR